MDVANVTAAIYGSVCLVSALLVWRYRRTAEVGPLTPLVWRTVGWSWLAVAGADFFYTYFWDPAYLDRLLRPGWLTFYLVGLPALSTALAAIQRNRARHDAFRAAPLFAAARQSEEPR